MKTEHVGTIVAQPGYGHVGYISAQWLNDGLERTPVGAVGLWMAVMGACLVQRIARRRTPDGERIGFWQAVCYGLLAVSLISAGTPLVARWLGPPIAFYVAKHNGYPPGDDVVPWPRRADLGYWPEQPRKVARPRHRTPAP